MALEFAELLRNFVPLGFGAEAGSITEDAMLAELVSGSKNVLEVTRGETLTAPLARGGAAVDVLDLDEVEDENAIAAALARPAYDAIVLSDVLPYVREPVRLLRQLRDRLAPGGFIVAALPNFGYGALRLAMLAGAYDFAREHEANPRLHFYTYELIESLLVRAGYRILETRRRVVPWESLVEQPQYAELDEAVINHLRRDPEHATMSFLVKTAPAVRPVLEGRSEDSSFALKNELKAARSELDAAALLNEQLREAAQSMGKQIAALRRKARVAEQAEEALSSALCELDRTAAVRDDVLVRLHSADAALTQICVERNHLRARAQELEEALKRLGERRSQELERAMQTLKQQNAQLSQANKGLLERAEKAERTGLELANELLESTRLEIHHLSALIDNVQRGRLWSFKRRLGSLLRAKR